MGDSVGDSMGDSAGDSPGDGAGDSAGDRWQGPFDEWERLPQRTRQAVLDVCVQRQCEVFDDIATYNTQRRALRPVFLSRRRYEALNALIEQTLRLVVAACRRRASTIGELRRALGVPAGRVAFLADPRPLGDDLAMAGRPDLLFAGGVPKFVEFNVGTDVGGAWDADTVCRRWRDRLADHGAFEAPPDATDARFDAMRRVLGLDRGARIIMAFRSDVSYPGMDDVRGLIRTLDPFVLRAREHGFELHAVPVSWLRRDPEGRLYSTEDPRPADAVLRMFVCSAMPPGEGLAALGDSLRDGTVSMYSPTADQLLSNKLVFSWLWDDLESLSLEDADLVRRHIPRTRVLTDELVPGALADRDRLVLKPTDEFGGTGVVVGRRTGDAEWAAVLGEALAKGRHLLQDYVRPDRTPMHFIPVGVAQPDGRPDPHAQVTTESTPFSIGPFSFGGRGAGCFIRIGDSDDELLSFNTGVHLTGVLLVDESELVR